MIGFDADVAMEGLAPAFPGLEQSVVDDIAWVDRDEINDAVSSHNAIDHLLVAVESAVEIFVDGAR